jgi:Glycogen debranching enzyme
MNKPSAGWRRSVIAALAVVALLVSAAAREPKLSYSIAEGRNLNLLYRDGPVAAHVVARAGTAPRLLVAFPAGNSGAGLWFKPLQTAAEWRSLGAPNGVQLADSKGRPLYGIETVLECTASRLEAKQAVLSSVRVLRDYEALGTMPDGLKASAKLETNTITYARDRLDGKAGYLMRLVIEAGHLENGAIIAPPNGPIRIRLVAASGETPLTPLSGPDLLNGRQRGDESAERALTFLSFKEKFLAGSWRFDTYFGRDTLMSVRLLLPVLTPEAVESGLRAVLTRLSPQGEVAHEEDIGEFAILDHRRNGEALTDTPVYDYKMLDGDFMLALVIADWLSSDPHVASLAKGFLAEPDPAKSRLGDALVRNLRHVIESARPFADSPIAANLIGLKSGQSVGEWRDSNTGLGGGHYPYDINAVFVPAALRATARLLQSGLLDPYLDGSDRKIFGEAEHMAAIWSAQAPRFFEITIAGPAAADAIKRYAREIGIPAKPALEAARGAAIHFTALALQKDDTPVRVQNSDIGFALLFTDPPEAVLREAAEVLSRPFPAGLLTGAGLLVANPAFASAEEKKLFNNSAYHGTVIWSWQQAVAAAGLARQLKRTDLSDLTRRRLREAEAKLWQAITAAQHIQGSELWSWKYARGAYQVVPFGAAHGDVDESNAVQLWSTVFLALTRPPPRKAAP